MFHMTSGDVMVQTGLAIPLTLLNFTTPITQNPLNDITSASDKGKDYTPLVPFNFDYEHFNDDMYEHFDDDIEIEEQSSSAHRTSYKHQTSFSSLHAPSPSLEESSITFFVLYVLLIKEQEWLQTEICLKEVEARVHAKEAHKLVMQIELRKLEVATTSTLKDN
ncbi:hypothetical protein F5I97DRAFT_1924795 [Phlebopus sp. FC_14]|nr:hypothetical protein F5I97DRAFT_1924795 [Phlebopus sp. FC_14]